MTMWQYFFLILFTFTFNSCDVVQKKQSSQQSLNETDEQPKGTWQSDTIFEAGERIMIKYESNDMLCISWTTESGERKMCIDTLIPSGESYLFGSWEMRKADDYFFVRIHRGIPKFRDFLLPRKENDIIQHFDTPIYYDPSGNIVVLISAFNPKIVFDIINIRNHQKISREVCLRSEWMHEVYEDLDTINYSNNALYVQWKDGSGVIHRKTLKGL